MNKYRIIRVNEDEFELDNGKIFPHFERLDKIPTVEEFQKMYDQWLIIFIKQGLIDGKTD